MLQRALGKLKNIEQSSPPAFDCAHAKLGGNVNAFADILKSFPIHSLPDLAVLPGLRFLFLS